MNQNEIKNDLPTAIALVDELLDRARDFDSADAMYIDALLDVKGVLMLAWTSVL